MFSFTTCQKNPCLDITILYSSVKLIMGSAYWRGRKATGLTHCEGGWYNHHGVQYDGAREDPDAQSPYSSSSAAVVSAGSCSSDSTPSLGTSICHRYGPKKAKTKAKQKKKKKRENIAQQWTWLCLNIDKSQEFFEQKIESVCFDFLQLKNNAVKGKVLLKQEFPSWRSGNDSS